MERTLRRVGHDRGQVARRYADLATEPLHVRPAALDDVDAVLDLLAEAAEWMESRGRPNWPARFSTRLVASAANAGELFVVEIDRALVATLTLQWSAPRFWGGPAPDGADAAGYVHRLAVRRAQSGRGLGYRLLDWADGAARASGRTRLRLDVVSDNEPLRRYYEEAGFAHQRDVEGEFVLPDGTRRHWRTSLYERSCAGGGA